MGFPQLSPPRCRSLPVAPRRPVPHRHRDRHRDPASLSPPPAAAPRLGRAARCCLTCGLAGAVPPGGLRQPRLSPPAAARPGSASRKPRLRSAAGSQLAADRPVPLAASLPPSLRPPSSWQGGWESAARLRHMPSLRSRPGPSAINQGASQAPPRLLQLL